MKTAISILVLSLLALYTLADDLPAGFRPWIEVARDADANGDGMLTPMEIMHAGDDAPGFRPFMAEHFMAFDVNGDAMLSMNEIKRGTKKMNMTEQETSKMFFQRAVYEGL